jgi:hypothetical protein
MLAAGAAARLGRPDIEEVFSDAEVAFDEVGSPSNLSAEFAFIKARTA